MKLNILSKIILTIILVFLTCSCKSRFIKPADNFKKQLDNASPDFRQGWLDGCDVGSSSGSNSFNQMWHKSRPVDGYKMAYSNDYQVAWNNAWWYCMRKDWLNQKDTIWSSVFGGYK